MTWRLLWRNYRVSPNVYLFRPTCLLNGSRVVDLWSPPVGLFFKGLLSIRFSHQ